MAANSSLLKHPADNRIYIAAAALFPFTVLIGYFKSYYFSAFFDVPAIANNLVHAHALVMSLWVVYFVAQIVLVRTKNLKLHMTLGMIGVALAALVVVVGLATEYDSLIVRGSAPPGENPHVFLFLPVSGMAVFVILFSGAIYYRRRPAAHKALMVLTALNFMSAALARVAPVPPEYTLFWALGLPALIAVLWFAWHTAKRQQFDFVFAGGVMLPVAMLPANILIPTSSGWLNLVALIAR